MSTAITPAITPNAPSRLALITSALQEGKGKDAAVLPAEKQSGGLFSHMIVVTAGSARHAAALAERVIKTVNIRRSRVEKSDGSEWVLIDCGDIIVHIMQDAARRHYALEELWGFEETAAAKQK